MKKKSILHPIYYLQDTKVIFSYLFSSFDQNLWWTSFFNKINFSTNILSYLLDTEVDTIVRIYLLCTLEIRKVNQ